MNKKNIAKLYLVLLGLLFVTFTPTDILIMFFALIIGLGLFFSVVFSIAYITQE